MNSNFEKISFGKSNNSSFDISTVPMNSRKILCLAGSEDKVANYYGGEGVLGYVFLNAQKSAYVFAKAMGYKGTEIPDELAVEKPKNFLYSYLNGKVVHYKLQGAGHGFREMNEDANQIIKKFFEPIETLKQCFSSRLSHVTPNKNPCKSIAYKGFCGERGIRTPECDPQRFSRPPHSTTLPFLLSCKYKK